MNHLFSKIVLQRLFVWGLMVLGFGSNMAYAELPQERVKAAKVAYLTRELGLSPQEAERFWPVYNEFENRRDDLRHDRLDHRHRDRKADARELPLAHGVSAAGRDRGRPRVGQRTMRAATVPRP